MKILFMGGTGFIGPHMVRALVDGGFEVTLFNRGKSNPGLFPGLELIKGDRLTDDIKQLSGRRWDVIVDTSAYVPRAVDALLNVIDKSALQQYVLISTISVYEDFSKPGISESSPTASLPDPTSEDVEQHYGALKVLCEKAVEATLPGKALIIRCGLIIGPGDHTDRFTYWPERVFRGGEVLAPGAPTDPIQTLDVRDLANWVALCVERDTTGTYNATNNTGVTFGDVLSISRAALNPEAQITWVPHYFLLEQGLVQMRDLPFWVDIEGALMGVWQVNANPAAAAGLNHRPLRQTIVDTHQWFLSLPEERRESLRAGIAPRRELEILDAWHATQRNQMHDKPLQ